MVLAMFINNSSWFSYINAVIKVDSQKRNKRGKGGEGL